MMIAKQEIERPFEIDQIEIIPLMKHAKTFLIIKRYSKSDSGIFRVYFNGVSWVCELLPGIPNGVSTIKVSL
jgi:hypothetical protein